MTMLGADARRRGQRPASIGLAVALAGCSAAESASDRGAWRGTVTTNGNVTTVVTESGSVWGGPATLVEQASIGLLEGAEEQMLGSITGVAFDDERILVADGQAGIVRIYDLDGAYVADLGARGQGPGEYEHPSSVALDDEGRAFVRDGQGRRILIYGRDGEFLASYPLAGGLRSGRALLVTPEAVPYTIVIADRPEDDPTRRWILGMQAHGPDGPYGEPIVPPEHEFERGRIVALSPGGRRLANNVPFWPYQTWTLTRELAIVSGVGTDYRFEIRYSEGAVLNVRNRWEPVAVQPAEAEWYRRRATAQMRSIVPDWSWNGPDVPPTKPAFVALIAARSGEIWVRRPGPGERLAGCNEMAETITEFNADPCWRDTTMSDAFGADGRFLGAIDVPPDVRSYPEPVIDGDQVVAIAEDADGTIMVKRYRLVRAR